MLVEQRFCKSAIQCCRCSRKNNSAFSRHSQNTTRSIILNEVRISQRRLSTRTNLHITNFECEVSRFARDDDDFSLALMPSLDQKGSPGSGESLFFAQFREDAEILERGRVTGYAFATGNFLE